MALLTLTMTLLPSKPVAGAVTRASSTGSKTKKTDTRTRRPTRSTSAPVVITPRVRFHPHTQVHMIQEITTLIRNKSDLWYSSSDLSRLRQEDTRQQERRQLLAQRRKSHLSQRLDRSDHGFTSRGLELDVDRVVAKQEYLEQVLEACQSQDEPSHLSRLARNLSRDERMRAQLVGNSDAQAVWDYLHTTDGYEDHSDNASVVSSRSMASVRSCPAVVTSNHPASSSKSRLLNISSHNKTAKAASTLPRVIRANTSLASSSQRQRQRSNNAVSA